MNRIEAKVRSARRRLVLGRFGQALCLTLFAGLLIAIVAIALPAIHFMDVDVETWNYSWIGGCLAAAFAALPLGWAVPPARCCFSSLIRCWL